MRRCFLRAFSVSISTWCGQITVENIYDCFSNIWKFKTGERNDAIDLWETIGFFNVIKSIIYGQLIYECVRVDCTHSKFSFWIKLKCRSEYCRWYITLLSMHDTTRTFLVANLAAWRLATDDGIAGVSMLQTFRRNISRQTKCGDILWLRLDTFSFWKQEIEKSVVL